MAATGLLGINPYGKGIALDISSKPAQYAIQLQLKEQAKAEALDKYLMDYEKSLNPNGMRQQDQDAFLSKLGEAKQYYIQNRDKILNPTKYGGEYQAIYFKGLRDAQNTIGLSKQAAAQDKLTTQHFISQKGLNAPDGYAEALQLSHLPINDPRYRPLDITQWKFYKTHNPIEYANKVYSKIPLSESAPEEVTLPNGRYYTKTTSKVDPQYKNSILQEGFTDYDNEEGLRKEMNHTFDYNKGEVKRLENKYNVKIPDAKTLAGYYIWDLQPVKEVTSDIKITPEYQSKLIKSRQQPRKTSGAETINFLQGGVTALQTLNKDFINNYFKPWKAQTKTGTTGDVIGFENIDVLPDGKIKVNYSIPMNVSSRGVSATVANRQSRIFDPKSPSLLQELTALHQELLGSNVGAERQVIDTRNPNPRNPPKPQEQNKPKSGINWDNK